MNFNFGDVLSRAWQIIWKHKILWIFGILASCSRGGSNFNSRYEARNGSAPLPPQLEQLFTYISQHATAFIVGAVTLACIFTIIAIFLGTIGRIGLIRGTAQVEDGAEHLIFGQLFSESTPYFWRMFGLGLLVGLPFLILIAVLVATLVGFGVAASQGSRASAFGFLGILPLFFACLCVLIPAAIVIGLVVRQSERAIVLENAPVLPSLSRGWDVFRSHLGEIIIMAIILVVIGLVVGFVIALPILIVVVPAVIAFAAGNGQNFTPLIIAGVLFCLYLPISLLLNGIFTAYTESAWTLTYMRLTGKPHTDEPLAADAGTPPPPPLDDGDKTVISSSHA